MKNMTFNLNPQTIGEKRPRPTNNEENKNSDS